MDPWLLEDCYGLPYHDNYDVGERIGAVLTDVSGIDDAHFLYSKDQVSLSQLGKEINEWYSNYDFEDEVRKAFAVSVSEKSYCVVKEGDGSFYRCYVISIARSDYTVLYVDYGKTVTCKEHTIYPIHHKFQQQPIFAVKCIFKRSSTEAFSQSGNAAFILKMEKYRSGKAYSWNIERLERGEPNEFEISFTSQSRMKYFNELVEQINLDYPLSNDADIETSSDIEDEISHRVDVESILEPTISTPSSGHTSVELLDDPSTHGGGPNIESYTCSAIDEALGFISPETQNSVLNDDDEHIESDISSTEEAHEKRQKKRKQLNKMEREKRQQMKRLDAKKKRDKEYRSDYNRRGPTQPTGWDNPGASTGQRSPPVYSNNNGYSNGNRFQNNDYGYAHGNARILYSKEPWSNGGKDLKKVDNDSNWKRSPGQSNTCSAVSGSSHSDSNNVVVGNGVVVDTGIEYGQNPTWSTVPGASFAPPPPLPPPQVQPLLSNRHGKPKEGYWNDNSITANVPPQSYGANQCNSGAGVVPSSGSVPFTGSPSKTFVLERGPQASVANVPGKGDDSSDGFRSARCTITNAPDFTVNDRIKLLDKIDGYRHSSQQSQAPAVGYSGNVSRELGSQVDDFVHVTPPASAKSFEIKFPSLPSIPTSPGRSDEVLPGWNLPVAIDCANLGPGRSSGMSTPMHSAVSSGQRTAVAMMPRLSPSLTFEHLFLAWPAIKRPVPNLTYYVRRSSADGLQYVNLKTIEHDEMSMKMAEHLADYGLLVQLQAKCSVLDFTDQIRGMIANKQHVACLARTTNNKWCRAVLWSLNSNCIDKNHLCNVKFVDSGEKTILPADDVCLIRRPHDINTYPFNIAPLCWPSSLVANSDRIEVSLQGMNITNTVTTNANNRRTFLRYKRISSYIESNADYKHRWCSLGIGFISTFVLVIQSSMGRSSVYPYLLEIDEAASNTFYGLVISAMAFGAIILSPVLSTIGKKLNSFKIPILLGFALNIVGNILILFVEEFQVNRRWVLFAARLFEGFGTGARGVLSAYTAMTTTVVERTMGLSIQSAMCSGALVMGPGIQALATSIGYPGYKVGPLHLNMYTTPALMCVILVTILAFLVVAVFKEANLAIDVSNDTVFGIPTESGAPLTMIMFNWSSQETVLYNGIIKSCTGVVDIAGSLLVANVVLKHTSERVMMIVGLLSIMACYVVSFAYPFILSNLIDPDATNNQNITTVLSCDYEWCPYTTKIYLAQYIAANIMIAISLSSAFAPTVVLLTKIVGPRHQRLYHGIMTTSDSTAFLCGPIVMSTIFQSSGPRVAWAVVAVIVASCFVTNILLFKRLLPHNVSATIRHSCSGSEEFLDSNL